MIGCGTAGMSATDWSPLPNNKRRRVGSYVVVGAPAPAKSAVAVPNGERKPIQVPLLSAMRKCPDKVQNKVFKIIHNADPKMVPQKTAEAAYNKLGAKEMAEKLLEIRCYCLDESEKNGEFNCGNPQKKGHVGDCGFTLGLTLMPSGIRTFCFLNVCFLSLSS